MMLLAAAGMVHAEGTASVTTGTAGASVSGHGLDTEVFALENYIIEFGAPEDVDPALLVEDIPYDTDAAIQSLQEQIDAKREALYPDAPLTVRISYSTVSGSGEIGASEFQASGLYLGDAEYVYKHAMGEGSWLRLTGTGCTMTMMTLDVEAGSVQLDLYEDSTGWRDYPDVLRGRSMFAYSLYKSGLKEYLITGNETSNQATAFLYCFAEN